MVSYKIVSGEEELKGILSLQKANLWENMSPEEIANEGFVTLHHNLNLLKRLNSIEPHLVSKDEGKVIAYVLTMTKKSREEISDLFPMFKEFDKTLYEGKLISEYNYMIVGQVCVDKNYRGSGVFDQIYSAYRKVYSPKYNFAITEIDAANQRSLAAHKRIGFKVVHEYHTRTGKHWFIVIWEWRNQVKFLLN